MKVIIKETEIIIEAEPWETEEDVQELQEKLDMEMLECLTEGDSRARVIQR